ncbi:MAG: hypothetical protein V8S24_15045, partial [Gordonibacter pamelaeae]
EAGEELAKIEGVQGQVSRALAELEKQEAAAIASFQRGGWRAAGRDRAHERRSRGHVRRAVPRAARHLPSHGRAREEWPWAF